MNIDSLSKTETYRHARLCKPIPNMGNVSDRSTQAYQALRTDPKIKIMGSVSSPGIHNAHQAARTLYLLLLLCSSKRPGIGAF
jgi:hypothetical protein